MNKEKECIEKYLEKYRTTIGRIQPKLPLILHSEQDTRYRLSAVYSLEVKKRGKEFELDKHTEEKIDIVSRWLVSSPKRGLILMGSLGNGKSTMLRAINDIFRPYSTLTDGYCIFDCFKQNQVERFWNAPFLLIDDMGIEPNRCVNYGEITNPMERLLIHRYNMLLTTIIATNLGLDEIQNRYGTRLVDRMYETFEVVKYDHKSYRRK